MGGAGQAALAYARSGVLALTGPVDGPPGWPPLTLPGRLDAVVDEIARRTTAHGRPVLVSWPAALAGRAVLLGLHRRGRTSANGSCRLLPAPNGWVALNLARTEDVESIPALIGGPVREPWAAVTALAARVPAGEFVARARLIGLAAAQLPEPRRDTGAEAARVTARWSRGPGVSDRPWHVVDFSSLWAGPVVARILAEAGALVTKIESRARPDGARAAPAFYEWIHSPDEASLVVNLRRDVDRRRVAALIEDADVVIEASRPRALEQLGLGPADHPDRAGRVWLSITGHGRDTPNREWVAFGDDAAVAGGLVGRDGSGAPVFSGDASADPVTGLLGALAVLRALDSGGGQLIDLAMSRAAASVSAGLPAGAPPTEPAAEPAVEPAATVGPDGTGGWLVRVGDQVEPVRDGPESLEWIRRG